MQITLFPVWILLLSLFQIANCIYDDEIDKIDWFAPSIGQFSSSSSSSLSSGSCFFLPNSNTFIGLNDAKSQLVGINGSGIVLREVIEQYDPVIAYLYDEYFIVSYSNTVVIYNGVELIDTKYFNSMVSNIVTHESKCVISLVNGELYELITMSGGTTTWSVSRLEISEKILDLSAMSYLPSGELIITTTSARMMIFDNELNLLKQWTDIIPTSLIGDKFISSKHQYVHTIKEKGIIENSYIKAHTLNSMGYLNQAGKFYSHEDNELIYEFGNSHIDDDVFFTRDSSSAFVVVVGNTTTTTLKKVDLESGVIMDEYELPVLTDNDKIIAIHNDDPDRGIMIMRSNQTIELYSNGQIIYKHEQIFPCGVKDWVLVSAPVKKLDTTVEELALKTQSHKLSIWQMYYDRLIGNVSKLAQLWNNRSLQEQSPGPGQSQSQEVLFGFDKLIIALSNDGKQISCVDVYNRHVIWEFETDTVVLEKLYTDKDGKVFVRSEDPQKIYEIGLNGGSNMTLVIENATGELIKIDGYWYLISGSSYKPLNLAAAASHAPDQAETTKYAISYNTTTIFGIILSPTTNHTQQTWAIPLNDGEKILDIAKRNDPNNDNIASIGVVLEDRRVRYKYLQPNMVIVSSILNDQLSIKMYNVITGEIVMNILHSADEFIKSNGDDEFHIVYDENFIAYTYYSFVPSMEQKIVIVDLFEHEQPDTKGGIINRPVISTKAFNFPDKIKAMTITKTKFNISSKKIVLLLENGQIVNLAKFNTLNKKPVPGVIQLNDKQDVLTNIHTLPQAAAAAAGAGANQSQAAPLQIIETNLESASILCSITGMKNSDLYCSYIIPSGRFDHLNESFNKTGLIVTLVVLSVLCIGIMRPLVKKKKLNSLWI